MRTESIKTAAELLWQADAVLVGAGSGLSGAAGYNHYHHNAVFEENFMILRKPMESKVFSGVLSCLLKAGATVGFLFPLY